MADSIQVEFHDDDIVTISLTLDAGDIVALGNGWNITENSVDLTMDGVVVNVFSGKFYDYLKVRLADE
tara:strand:+ start:91 stop:294 length:204 start_codon:yes stop_codon:yes gene_type:complete